MKQLLFILIAIILLATYSCGNQSSSSNVSKSDSVVKNSSATTNDETSASPLLDTTKLKSDLSDIISSVASGNPDTTKLKNAASDIMSTDVAMLSDSGIDKMYGNSNDPSVTAAKNALKKMRDGMGITPDKLDSIKKAAAQLKQGTSN
ncbi:MAG: hypothetical protein ABJA35_02885 [Parafilimonas sp.]